MRILDAHHHIWIPEQSKPDIGYAWLRDIGSMKPFGDPTAIQRDYEWSEFSAETQQHELVGSVYLQVDAGIGDPVAEIAWAQRATTLPADKLGLVGFVDFRKANAESIIEAQRQHPSFRGVRQILSYLNDKPELCFSSEHLLRNDVWRKQFALLSEHKLSFDAQLYPEQMAEAAEFFALHPSIAVVVDHCGSPYDQTQKGLAALQRGLLLMAELPHVQIKLSGFGMFNAHWNAHNTKALIDIAVEAFGYERVMFGSNFPVDKLMTHYDAVVQHVHECIETDGEKALSQVFETNARAFYQLDAG